MLDAFLADSVLERDGQLIVHAGPAVLVFDAAGRDLEEICGQPTPVEVFCALELDMSTPSSAQLVALAFSSPDRRRLYRDVLSANGIGRSSALAVLDSGEVRDTLRAVSGADLSYFQSVPGLGEKKAKAVITALKSRYQGYLPKAISVPVLRLVEARDALAASGEDPNAAEARLLQLLADGAKPASAEAWLDALS